MSDEKNPDTMSVDEQIKQAELQARLLELEIKKQTLDALKLEQEERKYHIKDLKATIAERDLHERHGIHVRHHPRYHRP